MTLAWMPYKLTAPVVAKRRSDMIRETYYSEMDLKHGVCNLCGEESNEILIGEDICVDCYESELFYQETMKGI